ncbi:MAG: hypothetical protein WCD37_13575 [Chloroflexia bacterium]
MDPAETPRGGGLLLQPQVLPDRQNGLAGPYTICRYIGWPTYLNSVKHLTVVRTDSDRITGLLCPDPTLEPGEVGLTLTTAPDITWWKGVELVRETSSASLLTPSDGEHFETLVGVYTQDSYHGPDICPSIQLRQHPPRSLFLQFRKAGAYGIHTTVYRIPFRLPGGHSLVLNWERDGALREL